MQCALFYVRGMGETVVFPRNEPWRYSEYFFGPDIIAFREDREYNRGGADSQAGFGGYR